jgi:hypothetical protein
MSYGRAPENPYNPLITTHLHINPFLGDSGWSAPQGRSISHPNPKPLKKKGKIGGLNPTYPQ